jgi:hypothetical protein
MAYIYRIDFDILPEQMSELEIGASLERTLGYLRTLLPGQTGYITSRAMHAVNGEEQVHLAFESEWETWEDLQAHRASSLSEDKVLKEFEPHVKLNDLMTRAYAEVD